MTKVIARRSILSILLATSLAALGACAPEEEAVVDEPVLEETEEIGDPEPEMAVAMTDLYVIADEPDSMSFIGSEVELSDVEVRKVVGRKAFTAGSDENHLLVVLDPQLLSEDDSESDGETGEAESEPALDLDPGDRVTITGDIRELPTLDLAREQWDLSRLEDGDLATDAVYIHAESVTKQAR